MIMFKIWMIKQFRVVLLFSPTITVRVHTIIFITIECFILYRPLIKKKKENASTKWYQKMANWPLKIIVLCFLLVVAVYLFYYVFIDKNIQSKADNDKYKVSTHYSIHTVWSILLSMDQVDLTKENWIWY